MFCGPDLKKDQRGSAVVEATILVPIMLMIYAGLVLLAMYLPTRALLQRATQYTATAIATQRSDTWLSYDTSDMEYAWITDKSELENVYVAVLHAIGKKEDPGQAETMVKKAEATGLYRPPGELTVEFDVSNYVVYKEISVTATRKVKPPINLSFVGFPDEIPITVTSTAVVQNGDEFVRNMDIAVDVAKWLDEKYQISDMFSKVTELFQKFGEFMDV